MKITGYFYQTFLALLFSSSAFAQTSVLGNNGAAANFLGWNAPNPFALRIEHQGTFPIDLTTAGNTNQMRITTLPWGAQLFPGSLFNNNLPGNRLNRVSISYDGNNPIVNPVSLLHLGLSGGVGIRHWMGNGIYISQGTDNCFFGMRHKLNTDLTGRTSVQYPSPFIDNNDAVINWGDNAAGPVGPGTDNLTFIHTDQEFGGGNFQNGNYGREIMRLIGTGNVGIGPVFFDNAQPQNLLHINNSNTNASFLQFTNQSGTGQTGSDGFHLGIASSGIAEIRQMENLEARFFTNNLQRSVITAGGDFGFNAVAPLNKVEITSSTGNPYFSSGNGSSGLRFTNLTSANTPLSVNLNGNVFTTVLAVDLNGDVVQVGLNAAVGVVGGYCTAGPPALTADFEIPLSSADYYFSGDLAQRDKVNIGIPCGSALAQRPGKFNVQTHYATNASGAGSYAIYGKTNSALTSYNYGVWGQAENASGSNAGVGGFALSGGLAVTSYGGVFYGAGATNANIGVLGYAQSFLGFPQPPNSYPGGTSIGIYGRAPSNGSPNNVDFAGYFDGDIWVNGFNSGSGYVLWSDQSIKNNVDTINNALQIIQQLQPKTYYYDTTNAYGLRLSAKKQYGFIAQQVNSILPELVYNCKKHTMLDSVGSVVTPSLNFSGLNYDGFIAIMMRAIQQLDARTKKQDQLMLSLVDCCNKNSSGKAELRTGTFQGTEVDVELNDDDIVFLDQNKPNPFAESCLIEFSLPDGFKVAQIVFQTSEGRILKVVDLKSKGRGRLNVFASDLSDGLYSYYLTIDGRIVDTKKLVKQN